MGNTPTVRTTHSTAVALHTWFVFLCPSQAGRGEIHLSWGKAEPPALSALTDSSSRAVTCCQFTPRGCTITPCAMES